MHPLRTNLHAFFADALVWMFDVSDGVDMSADFCRHDTAPALCSNFLFTSFLIHVNGAEINAPPLCTPGHVHVNINHATETV